MALRAAQQFETVKRLSELCPSNVAFPMSQLPPFHLLCVPPSRPPLHASSHAAPPTTYSHGDDPPALLPTSPTITFSLTRALFTRRTVRYTNLYYPVAEAAADICSQHRKSDSSSSLSPEKIYTGTGKGAEKNTKAQVLSTVLGEGSRL